MHLWKNEVHAMYLSSVKTFSQTVTQPSQTAKNKTEKGPSDSVLLKAGKTAAEIPVCMYLLLYVDIVIVNQHTVTASHNIRAPTIVKRLQPLPND